MVDNHDSMLRVELDSGGGLVISDITDSKNPTTLIHLGPVATIDFVTFLNKQNWGLKTK